MFVQTTVATSSYPVPPVVKNADFGLCFVINSLTGQVLVSVSGELFGLEKKAKLFRRAEFAS